MCMIISIKRYIFRYSYEMHPHKKHNHYLNLQDFKGYNYVGAYRKRYMSKHVPTGE